MSEPAKKLDPTLTRRKKAIFASIVFFGAPMLAETAVRIRDAVRFGSASPADQLYVPHPQLGKVPRPGAVLTGAKTKIKINALGFRGQEVSIPKPPGTYRIVCLGGSTTFGTYTSSNETTWPARLQTKLQQAYPHLRVEVINAGVPGYRLADSRINLIQRVLPLDPDLIVAHHACNDIKHQQFRAYGRHQQQAAPSMATTRWLTRHSALFDKLAKNIQIMRTPASGENRYDTLPGQAVRNFREHIEAVLAECEKHRLNAVLCTMATQFRANQPQETQRKAAGTALYYNQHLSLEGLVRAYRMFNAEIKAAAQDRGLPCADLFEAVPGDSRLFGDSVHYTDAGTELVAATLFNTLTEAKLLPSGPQLAATP